VDKRPPFSQLRAEHPWTALSSGKDKGYKAEVLEIFAKTNAVPFGEFVRELGRITENRDKLFVNHPVNGPWESYSLRLLMAALEVPKGDQKVNVENVRRLLGWLDDTKKIEIVEFLYHYFTQQWFFGLTSTEELTNIFNRSKEHGCYCVVWDNILSSFVLYYLPKKRKTRTKRLVRKTLEQPV